MPDAEASEKKDMLCGEILKSDLDAYRKLETWGSSLFLGALGLLAKQLVDWDLNPGSAIHMTTPMAVFPAAVGVIAFVFLRVVNFRSHRSRQRLLELAGRPAKDDGRSWGVLGLLLAIMPLLFGYTVSWSLAVRCPDRAYWFWWFTVAGILVFLGALVVHWWIRRGTSAAN